MKVKNAVRFRRFAATSYIGSKVEILLNALFKKL